MKRLLLLSVGTGGGEMFKVIFDELKRYKDLIVKNISISTYARNTNTNATYIEPENAGTYIKKFKPDVTIYETSTHNPFMTKILSYYKDKIFLVSIMDTDDNKMERFTEVIPDLICTPTKTIYEDMKNRGYNNLFLYTNPNMLALNNYKYEREVNRTNPNILLASQGVNELYRQKTNQIITAIDNNFDHYKLDIKLHPEEISIDSLVINNNIEILYKNPYKTIEELLLSYDLIIGVDCTLQLKSYILNIPTIFFDNLEEDISNFKNSNSTCVNFKYKDYMDCKDYQTFHERTKQLINIICNGLNSRIESF